jgi:hypothetical protein
MNLKCALLCNPSPLVPFEAKKVIALNQRDQSQSQSLTTTLLIIERPNSSEG